MEEYRVDGGVGLFNAFDGQLAHKSSIARGQELRDAMLDEFSHDQ